MKQMLWQFTRQHFEFSRTARTYAPVCSRNRGTGQSAELLLAMMTRGLSASDVQALVIKFDVEWNA